MSVSQLFTSLARTARCAVLSLCFLGAATVAIPAAAAQTQPGQRRDAPPPAPATSASPPPATSANTGATAEPDLSITANVTARELRFEVVPTPKVEFPGRPRRDTVWEAERTNLPPQVQPGVTYRDLGIRLKITSVFADIERIVAEALGEIPASDANAPPKTDSDENPQSPAGDPLTKTNEAAQPDNAPPSTSLTQTSPAPPQSQTRRARGRSGGAAAQRERP
jgi:hypothetical protein